MKKCLVYKNIDTIPENIRNHLLVKLSDNKDKETALYVAEIVAGCYDTLPNTVGIYY